jgi:hypothetical protein
VPIAGKVFLFFLIVLRADGEEIRAGDPANPSLGESFHLMYELEFDAARARIGICSQASPENPLCVTAQAASYLFEEFYQQGVLTSAFFLDDNRLLGGVAGDSNPERDATFLATNQRARRMAEHRLAASPRDADALLALTLTDGMSADFEALIKKRQMKSLGYIRRAEKEAAELLEVEPDNGDAYVAIGAANYIIGCLPGYKRFVLWFGGIHGDRLDGMRQLEVAVARGLYLQPLAKTLLALAAQREHQPERARVLFTDLTREFPGNPVFAHELSLLQKR